MVLSGRLVALSALGALLAAWSAAAVLLYAAGLALLAGMDLVLAGRIAALRLHREPSTPVRLGERGETVLTIANVGHRTLRATVRDAWVPSAGAAPRSQRLSVPAGERRRVLTALVPSRRGERRTGRVTIRSYGPLGNDSSPPQASCRCCRRSARAGSCARSCPGCGRSTVPCSCGTAARAASSTRSAAT
jgi:uncharacterized protein (DUF58 family)